MNSQNSKASDTHRLLLNISGKIDLKRSERYVALSDLTIYYTWENIKPINLKYLVERGMKNLPDGSYSASDIQDYFELIITKNETVTDNAPIRIKICK